MIHITRPSEKSTYDSRRNSYSVCFDLNMNGS